jgi:hypothetical protein
VLKAFVERDLHVFVPFGDGQPFDLAVLLGSGEFLRVQCKTAWPRRGCLHFNAYATDHGRGQGSYDGLADVFGVYFPPTASTYLVPVGLFRNTAQLRLEPTRNNQRRRIRWAEDYAFERWTGEDMQALVAGDQPDRLSLVA